MVRPMVPRTRTWEVREWSAQLEPAPHLVLGKDPSSDPSLCSMIEPAAAFPADRGSPRVVQAAQRNPGGRCPATGHPERLDVPAVTQAPRIRYLQRAAGNRAVAGMLAPGASRVDGPVAAATSDTVAVQRMIVRITDLGEMIGVKRPAIRTASKLVKGQFEKDPVGAEDFELSTVSAGGSRPLGRSERLIVVAHGAPPKEAGLLSSGLPRMGGYEPQPFAAMLVKILPEGYSGTIYLDGCYTGRRLAYRRGTSFIELCAAALAVLRPGLDVNVSGNIGISRTNDDGYEWVILSPGEAEIARSLGWPVVQQRSMNGKEIQQLTPTPFGMAFAELDGTYNDHGLSERATKPTRERQSPPAADGLASGGTARPAIPEGFRRGARLPTTN